MIKLKSLILETRIISPEESLLVGDITLYHGTTWEIAKKAKLGELGPVNLKSRVVNLLMTEFGETKENAIEIYNKYTPRRNDPYVLFLTPNRESAIMYAKGTTKHGGEIIADILNNYFTHNINLDIPTQLKYLITDEPAIITITVPLSMVLTHPHWSTPARKRILQIVRDVKKYKFTYASKEDVLKEFNIEVFVKEKIPAKYIQRIDKVL